MTKKMMILQELFLTFAKIGMFTFGGGYAMISLIDHECVGKKHWISSDELMDMTVIAESTPGPVAINCATYTGYKKAGISGAVFATLGMVTPSFFIILLISSFMDNLLQYTIVSHVFKGIRIAVSLLIMQTAVKMIHKMLKKGRNVWNLLFVVLFGGMTLSFNILGIRFSTIYLIIISGFLGYFLFSVPEKNRVEKNLYARSLSEENIVEKNLSEKNQLEKNGGKS